MALEIIKHRERVTHIDYALVYDLIGGRGQGYSFPCDVNGDRIVEQDNPGRDENYMRVSNDPNYEFMGITTYTNSFYESAQGKCKCGRIVYLDNDYGHGIDCECGRIYSMSGSELAPRSQWDDRYDDDDMVGYNVRFGYVNGDD